MYTFVQIVWRPEIHVEYFVQFVSSIFLKIGPLLDQELDDSSNNYLDQWDSGIFLSLLPQC